MAPENKVQEAEESLAFSDFLADWVSQDHRLMSRHDGVAGPQQSNPRSRGRGPAIFSNFKFMLAKSQDLKVESPTQDPLPQTAPTLLKMDELTVRILNQVYGPHNAITKVESKMNLSVMRLGMELCDIDRPHLDIPQHTAIPSVDDIEKSREAKFVFLDLMYTQAQTLSYG